MISSKFVTKAMRNKFARRLSVAGGSFKHCVKDGPHPPAARESHRTGVGAPAKATWIRPTEAWVAESLGRVTCQVSTLTAAAGGTPGCVCPRLRVQVHVTLSHPILPQCTAYTHTNTHTHSMSPHELELRSVLAREPAFSHADSVSNSLRLPPCLWLFSLPNLWLDLGS